jgi:hypothetical protein
MQQKLLKLEKFRRQMGLNISPEMNQYILGLSINDERHFNSIQKRKLQIVGQYLKLFKIFDFVRFIAVSGSIAAGKVKEDDDIDMFIVVKDYSAWLYRGILYLRLMLHGILRLVNSKDVNNKFCINFISEERGIDFLDQDIFVAHEIMYMIPIFNTKFKNNIICTNKWLKIFHVNVDKFCKEKDNLPKSQTSVIVRTLNIILFKLQYLYMRIMHHTFELDFKLEGYRHYGYIRSFHSDFKKKILSNLD